MSDTLSAEDRLAISDLLSRAAYALDEHNVEDLAECFSPEASFSLRVAGGELVGPFEGRDQIMGLMTGAMEQQTDQRRHMVSNLFFGDSPAGVVQVCSNLTLLATEGGRTTLLSAGVYRDEVEKQGGRWRLSRRHLDLDSPY